MGITHAKISGLTNPADPDLVGGEDWDADHLIYGSGLVGSARLQLTTGGAINSETFAGLGTGFSKTGTGTYRTDYSLADYDNSYPVVVASITTNSGAPAFLRVTLENDGDDYIQLVTINSAGTAINVDSGTLTLLAGAVFT